MSFINNKALNNSTSNSLPLFPTTPSTSNNQNICHNQNIFKTELTDENLQQFPYTMEIERLLRQFESGFQAVSVVEGICSDFIGGSETKVLIK